MDSNNQIDATISQDALAMFKIESEGLQPTDGPKKHRMKLLDFRLVFRYSTDYSTADVRLYVNRFRIDWHKGPIKYVPVKKLKKEKSLKSVLERARQKAMKPPKLSKSNGPRSPAPGSKAYGLHSQFRSEEHQSSPVDPVNSQQLFSQIPRDEHGTPDRFSRPGHSLLRAPTELLHQLKPSSRPNLTNSLRGSLRQNHIEASANKGSPQVTSGGDRDANSSQQPTPLAPVTICSRQGSSFSSQIRNEKDDNTYSEILTSEPMNVSSQRIPSGSAFGDGGNADSLSSQIPQVGFADTAVHESNQIADDPLTTNHIASKPPYEMEISYSRKRQRESLEIQSQPSCDEEAREESKTDSPSKKRQRVEAARANPREATDAGETMARKLSTPHAEAQSLNADPAPVRSSWPIRANPWERLETIPSSEVVIPKDQAQLLEKSLWIPPMPNEPMPQGHVPPSLLRQWNSIAQRRHQQAEEAKSIPDRPPTPTQGTAVSSDHEDSESEGAPIDWDPSPEQHTFESRLPADSSPVRQPSFIGVKTALCAGKHTASQMKGHNSPGDTTGLGKVPQSQTERHGSFHSDPQASAAEIARPLEDEDALSDKVLPSAQASLNELDADVGKWKPPQTLQTEASNQGPESSKKSPAHSSGLESAIAPNDDDVGDESDESMMDTSVPLGLGESWPEPTQSTQGQQEVTSSGSSLPGVSGNHVQVAETPATHSSRLHGNNLNPNATELRPSHKQLPSSQANKTSSPSRVLNTYPYHGSYEKSQSSNEGPNLSSHPSGDVSPRVDVEGTQTQLSSMNVPSQNATQSQEIVLDSSGPAHRHQDFSLSGQQAVAEPSSLPFASSHEPASMQFNEQTQASMAGSFSQDGPVCSYPTSHSNAAASDQECSPSRSQSSSSRENEGVSQSSLNTQNTQSAALVARRLAHIANPEKVAQAKEVYKRFCVDYSAYTGNFDHFIELCSRLQAVRAGGQLQRSFLWDDFIIMHLQQYSSHIKDRVSQDSETLSYEEYFLLNFTHPVHRKRSLTAHGIELAASQFIPAELAPLIASGQAQPDPPDAQDEGMIFSLATSLPRCPSDLHGHFIEEIAHNSPPVADHADFTSSSESSSSRSSSVSIKIEGPGDDYNGVEYVPAYSTDIDDSRDIKPSLSSLDSSSSFEQPPDTGHDAGNDDVISIGEVEETDMEETHLEDDYHETASVELGDDSFVSAAPASPSQVDAHPASPDAESEDENWFVSLRHIRPKYPVWSDDPNTPFKRYAEADQNVRSERLRRGGAKMLLDDKGVIRRAIHRD